MVVLAWPETAMWSRLLTRYSSSSARASVFSFSSWINLIESTGTLSLTKTQRGHTLMLVPELASSDSSSTDFQSSQLGNQT